MLLIPSFGESQKKENPVELGTVNWLRDYNEAINQSILQNKPIFILFQEVPGCGTCQRFGSEVLAHPLMSDAINNEFIPLAIFNNRKGADAEILKKYKEPSWNNPVVRIINHNEFELADRLSGDYSLAGTALAMKLALLRSHGKVPEYFTTLADEWVAQDTGVETAYYKMYCFWSGEAHLGKLKGVIKTVPGHMSCGEVVQVNYDPQLIDAETLNKYAAEKSCTVVQNEKRFRPDKDPQYYLKKSQYRYLPLSDAQKSRVNSALANNQDPDIYLSPQQKIWKSELSSNKSAINSVYTLELKAAWQYMHDQF